MQPKTRAIAALDALGLAAVAALFVLWCVHTPDLNAAGRKAQGCIPAQINDLRHPFQPQRLSI